MSTREGTLAARDFPELVRSVYESHWTGRLSLSHGSTAKSVIVQEGRLVFAHSSDGDDRMGERLLRQGRLTLRQYLAASRGVAPGRRLGTILVEQGWLPPKDLVRAVTDYVQDIIYGMFQWTEGKYRLEPEAPTTAETITLNINTPRMIVEGMGRIEAWSRVLRGIGSAETVYERAEAFEETLRKLELPPEVAGLLTALERPTAVQTVCEGSNLGDFVVCRTLWAFSVLGMIRRLGVPRTVSAEIEDEGLSSVLAQE